MTLEIWRHYNTIVLQTAVQIFMDRRKILKKGKRKGRRKKE
jgi:hypothetical protein